MYNRKYVPLAFFLFSTLKTVCFWVMHNFIHIIHSCYVHIFTYMKAERHEVSKKMLKIIIFKFYKYTLKFYIYSFIIFLKRDIAVWKEIFI